MLAILRCLHRQGDKLIDFVSTFKPAGKILKKHWILRQVVGSVPFAVVLSPAMVASEREGRAWIRSKFSYFLSKKDDSDSQASN